MTPSMTESDPLTGKPAVELALGQRQIAAIGFVAVLLLGCVATMAYVAGRTIGPGGGAPAAVAKTIPAVQVPSRTAAATAPIAVKPASSGKVEQLIMVEAAAAPATTQPSIMSARAAEPPPLVQQPAAAAKPATPELKPLTATLLAGNTFWQVAAIDLGMAQVTCELLTRKGLPAVLGDSPSPGIYRVLVGPVHTPEESTRHKAVLDEAGFHPFIKKY